MWRVCHLQPCISATVDWHITHTHEHTPAHTLLETAHFLLCDWIMWSVSLIIRALYSLWVLRTTSLHNLSSWENYYFWHISIEASQIIYRNCKNMYWRWSSLKVCSWTVSIFLICCMSLYLSTESFTSSTAKDNQCSLKTPNHFPCCLALSSLFQVWIQR